MSSAKMMMKFGRWGASAAVPPIGRSRRPARAAPVVNRVVRRFGPGGGAGAVGDCRVRDMVDSSEDRDFSAQYRRLTGFGQSSSSGRPRAAQRRSENAVGFQRGVDEGRNVGYSDPNRRT